MRALRLAGLSFLLWAVMAYGVASALTPYQHVTRFENARTRVTEKYTCSNVDPATGECLAGGYTQRVRAINRTRVRLRVECVYEVHYTGIGTTTYQSVVIRIPNRGVRSKAGFWGTYDGTHDPYTTDWHCDTVKIAG